MRTKGAHVAGVVVLAVLAGLVSGCGSSGSNASSSGSSTRTSVRAGGTGHSATTTVPSAALGKPNSAELAGLRQQLNDAGSSIAAADSAVSSSDVNTAQAQEGNAP